MSPIQQPSDGAATRHSTESAGRRGWRWYWIVAIILGVLGLLTAAGFGIFLFVMSLISGSDIYTHAVDEARVDPRVRTLLGEPMETGWLTTGRIEIVNGVGDGKLAIPLSGPRGGGVLHATGHSERGVVTYSELLFVHEDGQRVDLREAFGPPQTRP